MLDTSVENTWVQCRDIKTGVYGIETDDQILDISVSTARAPSRLTVRALIPALILRLSLRARILLAVVIVGLIAVAVVMTSVVLGSAGSRTPVVAADNISRNARVCLAAAAPTPGGQDDPATATTWAALQNVASSAPVNAQRVSVPDSDASTVPPYLNGMIQRRCGVVLVVGVVLGPSALAVAQANPATRFVVIDGPPSQSPPPNVILVTDAAAVCPSHFSPCPAAPGLSLSQRVTTIVHGLVGG